MVVNAPDGLVSLTAAKTHKFVIITGIIAPEVLLGTTYATPVDIWSAGLWHTRVSPVRMHPIIVGSV